MYAILHPCKLWLGRMLTILYSCLVMIVCDNSLRIFLSTFTRKSLLDTPLAWLHLRRMENRALRRRVWMHWARLHLLQPRLSSANNKGVFVCSFHSSLWCLWSNSADDSAPLLLCPERILVYDILVTVTLLNVLTNKYSARSNLWLWQIQDTVERTYIRTKHRISLKTLASMALAHAHPQINTNPQVSAKW